MLFQVSNLFLVAQSLLVVAFTTVLSAAGRDDDLAHRSLLAARVIASFGLLLTASWLYVGHQQLSYSRGVQRRSKERLADYTATLNAARRSGLRAKPLVVYVLPALAGALWLMLLLIA
ncbi:hypothetical protein [Streptomyces sp. NPDC005283]|uniref:hypothetical protein n=1 Tax=Streptomyces sp. NPDC005283 TaxID=3156871 RepID=UPI003455D1DB